MTLALLAGFGVFAYSARKRWRLMTIGPSIACFDNIPERVRRTVRFAFGQARMPRYRGAGIAHILIFSGFLVLLLRTLILWGRGYDEGFHLWDPGNRPAAGQALRPAQGCLRRPGHYRGH